MENMLRNTLRSGGTYLENDGKLLEHNRNIVGNREKPPKKSSSHPPATPKLNRKKSKAP
jgi:hypothetical protein